MVERYLSAAWDCHLALPKLLDAHGATQVAMWAIMRSQFEAAFMALWLLDPEESRERVVRGVRAAWLDDRHSAHYSTEILGDELLPTDSCVRKSELEKHTHLTQKHNKIFSDECAQLGFPYKKPNPIDLTKEIAALKSEGFPEQRVLLRHVWRTLAGLQHGDVGALLRVSDQDSIGQKKRIISATLSPADTSFQTIAETVALLTTNAFNKYAERNRPTGGHRVLDLGPFGKVKG
jgi:hypothetical protein